MALNMERRKVRINPHDIDEVTAFVTDMNSFHSDVNGYSDNIVIDVKSYLSVFGLGRSEFYVEIITASQEEMDRFREVIKKYEV